MHFFVSGKGKENCPMILSAEKSNKNLLNYLFHARNLSTRIFKSSHSKTFHYVPAVESKKKEKEKNCSWKIVVFSKSNVSLLCLRFEFPSSNLGLIKI